MTNARRFDDHYVGPISTGLHLPLDMLLDHCQCWIGHQHLCLISEVELIHHQCDRRSTIRFYATTVSFLLNGLSSRGFFTFYPSSSELRTIWVFQQFPTDFPTSLDRFLRGKYLVSEFLRYHCIESRKYRKFSKWCMVMAMRSRAFICSLFYLNSVYNVTKGVKRAEAHRHTPFLESYG